MSYQVLARKWRPNNFSELVGQEHVVAAISNALDNDRLHHAYLFTGTRGVGKTTIARIFSKSLNCELGIGSKPCGQCSTCIEIEQGNFVDLLEIDAASRTKVEDTRELLDNVQYRPTRGRYKVYLIDEVHMLSKHSFNALLKTLEEPPPHVKFLLATTDPQKLPITILSRCLQFNLKALSRAQIGLQLQHVFAQEHIANEPEALAQLARAAQGSMRDALSLSDQAIAQGNGNVSLSIVTDMLGLMDKTQVLKLLNAVLNKQNEMVFELVELMSEQAADYSQVLNELMSLLHQIALTQFVPDACKLETISARAIYQLAKKSVAEHIQLLYQIALQGKRDLPFAADAKTGLEMTLLRMLAFSPVQANTSIDELIAMTPSPAIIQSESTVDSTDLSSVGAPESDAPLSLTEVTQSTEQTVSEVSGGENIGTNEATAEIQSSSLQKTDLTNDTFSELTQIIEPEQANTANHHFDDEQYHSAQMQELEAQQHGIMQEAEHFIQSQNTDQYHDDEALSAHHEPAINIAPTDTQSPPELQSQSTESLLALRRKLAQAAADEEDNAPSVKKSEGGYDASQFLPGGSGPGIEPMQGALPRVKAQVQSEVSNAPSTANIAHPDIPIHEHNETFVGIEDSAPAVDETPPWATDEVTLDEINISVDEQEVISGTEEDIENAIFDPTAHLAQDLECEVNYDVPAFLASGEKVTIAPQLDKWSALITQMQVAALTKQLALHSEFSREDNTVVLHLVQSKEHLNTASAREQLQQALSDVLQQAITLEVSVGEAVNTPFALQQSINRVRFEYAKQIVETDDAICMFKDMFNAQVLIDSIKAR
ncbi:DNA polymerase III subunit gamma/tau [Paraglaciecola sp. 20A4]|uniref:DNA polymerase III subunit gamma/tau n=1 Tax=Paraglaciecola sp. 20A4 TaxID=2687288 RepID=UPI00140788F7|nr:DNA polymerase III subunit gamma/tau [Paraglaciecola sp. 20A4]